MQLYAISDLHLSYTINYDALAAVPPHPDDWLILAGDVGETEMLLEYALSIFTTRFQKVIWVPGNHDLWTMPQGDNQLRGQRKYERLVQICRDYGVVTPEDPYIVYGGHHLLVPLFLLYDYSYRPEGVPENRAVRWAIESGIICADEELLSPEPYRSFAAWCTARCRYSEARLKTISPEYSLILINHFPLRKELAILERFPRFSLWCGTTRTEDWHKRYPVSIVIYGHIHHRSTKIIDTVRFEEVSLGYPQNWQQHNGIEFYFRKILPVSDFYYAL